MSAPLLMLSQPFLTTAARIIMKMITAPATDIPIYIDSSRLSFRVGVVPTLIVVGESSCLYSSVVTYVTVVPARVATLVLLTVVKMRHSETKRSINPKLHGFCFNVLLCLSSFF